MPTTPTFALPYPALADAPNSPAQVQALAERADTVLRTVTASAPRWEYAGGNGQAIANATLVQYVPTVRVAAVGLSAASAAGAAASVTIATAGMYVLAFGFRFTAGAGAGERTCTIRITRGTATFRVPGSSYDASRTGTVTASEPVLLQAGDIVRPWMYQASGGTLNIDDAVLVPEGEARFTGVMVSA